MQFNLWENENGVNYGGDFLESQGDSVARKLAGIISDLQSVPYHHLLRSQKVKKIEGDLYEIRQTFRGIKYRFLFIKRGDIGWIVEAFIKKTNKTPMRHIDTAKQRAKHI